MSTDKRALLSEIKQLKAGIAARDVTMANMNEQCEGMERQRDVALAKVKAIADLKARLRAVHKLARIVGIRYDIDLGVTLHRISNLRVKYREQS